MSSADAIASAVLDAFDKLPANRKPAIRSNAVREWVPLSGIVAEFGRGDYTCVALATGMKCLPISKLPQSKGVGIHDWHAEVLALRAFNLFLLQECRDTLLQGEPSCFLERRKKTDSQTRSGSRDSRSGQDNDGTNNSWTSQPFCWRTDVALHMYCSEAPCGDASMELTMAAQEDASPWSLPLDAADAVACHPSSASETPLSGRGYFSRLGTVRRKPGRGDAPPTLSKSCSDKLALRQCTTLLSSLTSLLVAPCPALCLRSIVLPATEYSEIACRRCFSADADAGRMASMAGRTWPGGYAFTPLTIHTTNREFIYSKRSVAAAVSVAASPASCASSNLSAAWTLNGTNECLVNGILRGRRAFDPAGASTMSRRQMWKLSREVADAVEALDTDDEAGTQRSPGTLQSLLRATTYAGIKTAELLTARECVKQDVKAVALRGWINNEGDTDWGLDTL